MANLLIIIYNKRESVHRVNNKVTKLVVHLESIFNKRVYMTNKKITVVGNTRKFNIDLSKLPDEILSDPEGISCTDIQQSKFVSKINKAKKPGGAMPSPRDLVINFGKGLDHIYDTKPASNQADYPEGLNPFASGLKKIRLRAREGEWLSRLKSAIVTAKNPSELNKVVDEAIAAGMRMNGCHEGGRSFAEYVILGMHSHKFKKGDQKKIIRKLMLSGAEFDTLLKNKLVGEIYKELQPEVQPQIDKQLEERRKAGENAVQGGSIVGMEMDNDTSLWEFSEGSAVEVAKALEGIGPNRGLGSNIIKIGDGEIEIRNEEGGKRNYIDISGRFEIEFPTSIGKLRIAVYNDEKQVQARVVDKEMWFKLQTKGEEVAKDCLFGGMKIEEAVKRGSFTRSCFLGENKAPEVVSEALSSSLWTDRIHGGSQETFRAR